MSLPQETLDEIRHRILFAQIQVRPERVRFGVVGSRSFWKSKPINGAELVGSLVLYVHELCPDAVLVSGRSPGGGPDVWAEQTALQLCVPPMQTEIYLPDPELGVPGLFIRNTQIANASDILFAFWTGRSKGTLDTLKKCSKTGTPAMIIGPDGRWEDYR